MTAKVFLDSNVLVYAAIGAGKDDYKRRRALDHSERFVISYWDAAILSTARALGSDTVYSEDLSDGQIYAGVRVVNPFSINFRSTP